MSEREAILDSETRPAYGVDRAAPRSMKSVGGTPLGS
jgi:hypothetical protein